MPSEQFLTGPGYMAKRPCTMGQRKSGPTPVPCCGDALACQGTLAGLAAVDGAAADAWAAVTPTAAGKVRTAAAASKRTRLTVILRS